MEKETKTILLVEDNPDDEVLIRRALAKSNIKVDLIVARDGVEALDFLFATGPYAGRDPSVVPQIILLDLKMPRVDGLEVLSRLRADHRTRLLPVIILSLSKEEKDIIDGYSLGANSYVRKSVDFVQFSETIRQLGQYWLYLNEAPPRGTMNHPAFKS